MITKIYGEEDFTTIQKVKCTYQTPEGIDKSIYLLFPDISITIDAFREAFSIFFNGEVEIDFFDNKSNKLNITEVTDKTITKNRLQFYFVNLATIIDKYLKNALSLDVFLSFIFKDKKVEPLKFSNFDCFKKKDICAFSNTRIYCGFDEKSPTYEEIKKKFDMKLGDPCHLAFSGRSGCGKSAMIAELSKTYPVIYLDLNLQTTIKNNLIDCFPDYCKKLKT